MNSGLLTQYSIISLGVEGGRCWNLVYLLLSRRCRASGSFVLIMVFFFFLMGHQNES